MSESEYPRKPVIKLWTNLAVSIKKMAGECNTFEGTKYKSTEPETKYVTDVKLLEAYKCKNPDTKETEEYPVGTLVTMFPTQKVALEMNAYDAGAELKLIKEEVSENGRSFTRISVSPVGDTIPMRDVKLDLTDDESTSLTKLIEWSMSTRNILEEYVFCQKWLSKYPKTDGGKAGRIYQVYISTFNFVPKNKR